MPTTISESYLAKHLTDVLDRVLLGNEAFEVQRSGKVIASLQPPEPLKRVTWSQFVERLRELPPLDEDFARDIAAVKAEQPPAEMPEWPC